KLNAFSVVAKDDSNTVSATAIPVQVVVGESYNGHIYLLSTSASWNNAEAQAIAMGGHLVTINSLAENSWVGSTFNVGNFWIGLTDKITEGTFVWASGEILSYTNWNAGEPNGENFVQMRSSPYYWNDAGSTGTDSNGTAMGIIELIGI
ncbi:MAG: lectin-like protein, partial [Methylococcales bacterium]|nr:lectin-like protein [Methylococcales bacterium]